MPRRSVSPSTVLATLALFLAVAGGSAVALKGRNSVDSGDIKDGQVRSRDLRDAGVASSDLAPGSVDGAAIGENSVGGADVADASLTGADVTDGTLTGADLGENSVGGADVDEGSLQIPDEVAPISVRVPAGTNVAELFDAGGLRLTMDCALDGAISVFRTNDAGILVERGGTEVFTAGSDAFLLPVANNDAVVFEPTYRRDSDGRVVRAEITFVTRNAPVGTDCVAMGMVATG